MSWPTIRIPGPRSSGKWTAGDIQILCFRFSDRYPTRLNNFLWDVRGWPVIGWVTTLWARGGLLTCLGCRKKIWPSEGCGDMGNALADDKRYLCARCDNQIRDHGDLWRREYEGRWTVPSEETENDKAD